MGMTVPIALLPHRAAWEKYAGNNGTGDEWAAGVPFRGRFESTNKLIQGKDGRTFVASWFVVAYPGGIAPEAGDRLSYRGQKLELFRVDEMLTIRGTPYSYELWAGVK